MNVKLLLDENISPKVAEVLRRDGIDACGVRGGDMVNTVLCVALDGAMSFEVVPSPN